MKRTNILLLYIVSFLVGTGIFVDLFHTGLFGSMDVFFYRGIALLGAASMLVGSVLFVVRKLASGILSLKDIYIILITFVSVNLLFFTHVPVTAERSVSVFLLGYMNAHENTVITREDLTQTFLQKYIGVDDNIQKRIHEQLVSGNIVPEGNGYVISRQGKWVMRMYEVVANIFAIHKTNVFQ